MAIPPFASAPGGGTINTATGATAGSVLFAGTAGVLAQDNANFFWENTNDRLALGNTATVATSQTALGTGDYLVLGLGGIASATGNRTAIVFNNQGWAAPVAPGSLSNGDKLVFYGSGGIKIGVGIDLNSSSMWFQAVGNVISQFQWYSNNVGVGNLNMTLDIAGLLTTRSPTLHATSTALTNGAAAAAGTLTNAPVAGNPTKWVPIIDNGVTRFIPAW